MPNTTPAQISAAQRLFVLDASDVTSVPGANGDNVGTVHDLYVTSRTIGQGSVALQPTINTAGGVGSNKRVLQFANDYLWSFPGANNTGLIGAFSTGNFTTGTTYFALAAKTDLTGIERFVSWVDAGGSTVAGYRHTTTHRGFGYNVSGTARGIEQASPDTNWHVIEVIKDGASVTVALDGTDIATGTILDTGNGPNVHFLMGGTRSGGTTSADFTGQVAGMIVLNTIPDGVSVVRSDIRAWLAARAGL